MAILDMSLNLLILKQSFSASTPLPIWVSHFFVVGTVLGIEDVELHPWLLTTDACTSFPSVTISWEANFAVRTGDRGTKLRITALKANM